MSDNPSAMSDNIQNIPFSRGPFFRWIYSNYFRYLPLPSDFSVTFSKTLGNTPGAQGGIVDEIEVTVNYIQLKIIYEHLSEFIRIYENEFGTINTPPTQKPDVAAIANQVALLKAAWD
jgi:hypothetical protein